MSNTTGMIWAAAMRALKQHWLVMTGLAFIFAMLLFHTQFQLTIVVGDSMMPTLKSGDLLLVDKRAYQKTNPRRGDIVVARYASGLVVKRIVGLAGEEVEVRSGTLYINGIQKQENHRILQGPLDVRKGKLFDGDLASLGD